MADFAEKDPQVEEEDEVFEFKVLTRKSAYRRKLFDINLTFASRTLMMSLSWRMSRVEEEEMMM